ncbi:FxsA family protein [Candidatus Poribacteria bacterium]|nr:FxsA family protein [Candidatus Poribacteria bacterium]
MNTRRRFPIGLALFLLFAGFTLLELWLLLLLTKLTSLLFTIAFTILCAMLGSAMAKRQGFAIVAQARTELAGGRFPAQSLADGVMVLLGGALLITPGLITDFIGFTTLIPACRRVYARVLMNWARRRFTLVSATPGAPFRVWSTSGGNSGAASFDAAPGSYERVSAAEAPDGAPVDVEFERTD